MLVVYEGNGEVIICEKEQEEAVVKVYFTLGCRDLESYDRTEADGEIYITSSMSVAAF